jgi:alpha-ketoglutaric semialdehyde dehydrogenase
MAISGQNFIGKRKSSLRNATFRAVNPAIDAEMEPAFHSATAEEVNEAMRLSQAAWVQYQRLKPGERANFLRAIAAEIEKPGDELISRAGEETGLPAARLTGERTRTTGQLRMFADLVQEGSWVDARIDHANPNRQPAPKPDLRRMLVPIGPVAVFGASNFPLAFSVAGGDTASALAAGCTVVIKGHPSHPGTSELVFGAIANAIESSGMPDGTVSLLQGNEPELSLALVRHPLTQAVGFTGSQRVGRVLFDAAAARPIPIPVYAEMGSINPVFILPGAMVQRGNEIALGLKNSALLGNGQFCTKPGVVVCSNERATEEFIRQLGSLFGSAPAGTMLNRGLARNYAEGRERRGKTEAVVVEAESSSLPAYVTQSVPAVFTTTAENFISNLQLREELFGPAILVVTASVPAEFQHIAAVLDGQLTATIHAASGELAHHRALVQILQTKAGRLIFNGYPTGVEVCPAMQHGGPYPASTDFRSTSVGTAAILRFARSVCFQDFPPEMLPAELQDSNPTGIWRLIDGEYWR